MKKLFCALVIIAALLASVLALALKAEPVNATGIIYIRADGSIDPPTAPIFSHDGIAYAFTGCINESVVVEKSNIVIDGAGYSLEGHEPPPDYIGYEGEGLCLTGISNVTIKNMNIHTWGVGVALVSCSQVTISASNMSSSTYDVSAASCSLIQVSKNSIEGYYAITFGGCVFSSISENSISGICGPWLTNSSFCTISANNITSQWSGITLDHSSNNTIAGNSVKGPHGASFGICDRGSSDHNSIFENNISYNGRGILLGEYSGSDCNSIFLNNITENQCGINVRASSNAHIYDNSFVNNTMQALLETVSENIWDSGYPLGGNYWDDYADVDTYSGPYQNETGADGFWDDPYIIGENNQDNYPSVCPYWYSINPLLGDVNMDMKVDITDIFFAARAFGTYHGHPRWNPMADINKDDYIGIDDIYLIAQHFGQEENP